MRDLTTKQFDKACQRHGFTTDGVMGYYRLPGGVYVSCWNAGANRRARLAYLIEQSTKLAAERERALMHAGGAA